MADNNVRVKRKRSLLFTLMVIISVFVISTSVIFTLLLINFRTKDIVASADSRLLSAVELNREITGPDYHDRIENEKSVSKEQFNLIVAKNDDLCRRLNLQYLWSVLSLGGGLVFTSATHSDLNNPASPCAVFFEKHHDPDSFTPVFSNVMTPFYSTFRNEWGKGRQVLVSRKDSHGRMYIFGASMALSELDRMVYRTIFHSISIGLVITFIAFIPAFFITSAITKNIAGFISAADRMANGDLDVSIPSIGINELHSLFSSLEKIRSGLKLHIAELSESEQKYRSLHESAGAGIGYYTPDGTVISYNKLAVQHMKGRPEDFKGKSIRDIFPEEDADVYMARIKTAVNSEFPGVYEDKINLPSGTKWFHSIFTRVMDPSGEVIGIQIISNDISGLKLAEEENSALIAGKELLLQEVHHRIKNNMNSIKGLITLQLSAEKNISAAASLRDAESRIQSMILLYERLYCNENYRELPVKDYLHPLALEIINGFPQRSIVNITTEIDDFILNVNQLTPLGIILNEILTNIMKYAFTGRDEGLIAISVVLKENTVTMSVQDNGIGIPEFISFENSTGFGMRLVSMLTEQIGGFIKIERGSGTKVVLEFEAGLKSAA